TPYRGAAWPADVDEERLRSGDFPGTGTLSSPDRPRYPHFDIVHVVGDVGVTASGPSLLLGTAAEELPEPTLRRALLAARTRLLILQVPDLANWFACLDLAHRLVDGGIPAVLAVQGLSSTALDDYF